MHKFQPKMKHILPIISLIYMVVLTGCNHKEYHKILKAESLIESNRDSAMLLLNEVTQIELLPDSLQADKYRYDDSLTGQLLYSCA